MIILSSRSLIIIHVLPCRDRVHRVSDVISTESREGRARLIPAVNHAAHVPDSGLRVTVVVVIEPGRSRQPEEAGLVPILLLDPVWNTLLPLRAGRESGCHHETGEGFDAAGRQ